MTYGTERANAYKILEDTLNLRDVRIYDTITDADGKEKRVLNSKETTLAQQKQQAIKDAFQEWIWKDPTRRHELVQKYNELFNATRPREYNGQHITDVYKRQERKNVTPMAQCPLVTTGGYFSVRFIGERSCAHTFIWRIRFDVLFPKIRKISILGNRRST